jgi:hypothetical protein
MQYRSVVAFRICASIVGLTLSTVAIIWYFGPPIGSKVINAPPPLKLSTNKPEQSVYFGDGCFWHTQYDMFIAEEKLPFNRNQSQITSLAGYGGGRHTSSGGNVCYHGSPSTDYSKLGYTEVVSVQLDGMGSNNSAGMSIAKIQFAALCKASAHYILASKILPSLAFLFIDGCVLGCGRSLYWWCRCILNTASSAHQKACNALIHKTVVCGLAYTVAVYVNLYCKRLIALPIPPTVVCRHHHRDHPQSPPPLSSQAEYQRLAGIFIKRQVLLVTLPVAVYVHTTRYLLSILYVVCSLLCAKGLNIGTQSASPGVEPAHCTIPW